MEIVIRKTKEEELKTLAEIYAQGFSIKPYYEKWTAKTALIRIKQYLEFCEVYSILNSNRVIGIIILDTEKWYDGPWIRLWELVIDQDFRRKGIGKKAIEFIEDYAKKIKAVRIILETHKKSDAFLFYDKLGYKENGWVLASKDLE